MSQIIRSEFDAVSRIDFMVFAERVFAELHGRAPFHDAFYLHAIAAALWRVYIGKCRRLIINVPPRSMKSIFGSVAFPAFVLGHRPSTKFICASYGQDLADDLGRNCRQVMMSNWYRGLFRPPACRPTSWPSTTSAPSPAAFGWRRPWAGC